MRLLHAFKAARLERDGATFGSPEWEAADRDIQRLQRQIFDVATGDAGDRQAGSASRDSADGSEDGGFDSDEVLGEPEPPSAI